MGYLRLVGPGRIRGLRGVETHVARRARLFALVRPEDGLDARLAFLGADDGLVDAVRRIMGELNQKQELRERVVLARQAFSDPALGDAEQLRKQPHLVAILLAKVFL